MTTASFSASGTWTRKRSQASGKKRATSPYSHFASARREVVTALRTISDTRAGCRSAYARASVDPHEPPERSHRSKFHLRREGARVGGRTSAPALIEEDDPVPLRIECPPHVRRTPLPRPPVEHDSGFAVRRARNLPRADVALADFQHAPLVRLNRRIEILHDDSVPAR